MTPEQAAFFLAIGMKNARDEFATTKRVIEAIPADQAGYKPDAVSKSALELAWHIVATERRFLSAVASGAFDLTPAPMPETIKTPADLVAMYSAMFEEKAAAAEKISPEQAASIIDFRGIFQMPLANFILFMLKHSIHHRGQLSQYLRPMGAKVPAIYGESYDSAQARAQAKG